MANEPTLTPAFPTDEQPQTAAASPPVSDPFKAAAQRVQPRQEPAKPATPAGEPFAAMSSAPDKPVRRGGVGFLTALVMSLLATAGGAYLALFAQSRPDLLRAAGISALVPAPAVPSAITSELAGLSAKIAAIETQVSTLRQTGATPAVPPVVPGSQPAAVPPASTASGTPGQDAGAVSGPAPGAAPVGNAPNGPVQDFGGLKAQIDGVSGRVTAIETRLAALDPTGAGGAIIAGLQTEIANLKAVVANLQQQAANAPSPGVTFAVVSLAEAANRPGPFLPEFEAVRAAMPNVPEVAMLEPLARSGAPTRALLLERFAALAPAVAQMSQPQAGQGGFFAWFKSLFSEMVKVQPAATTTDSGPAAILMRAKTKLDQGDLAGAVVDVRGVAPAPDEVRAWIAGAEKRLEIEAKVAALRGAVERGRASPPPVPAALPVTPQTGAPQTGAPQTGAAPAASPPPSAQPSETQP
jgi:hypothetical protein